VTSANLYLRYGEAIRIDEPCQICLIAPTNDDKGVWLSVKADRRFNLLISEDWGFRRIAVGDWPMMYPEVIEP
jgi:hypothetical protein